MFKPSSLVLLLAAVAVCTAVPADQNDTTPARNPVTELADDAALEDTWFGFPFFSTFFGPIFRLIPSFADVGPNVISDDDKLQVAIPVKNYSKDALKVKVKNCYVTVQGSQETKPGDQNLFASQFFHTYSLPANASAEDVTANLTSDGWLIVTAPVTPDGATRRSDGERIVEIKETGKPRPKSELPSSPNKDTKVEGTTKGTKDREEVTERDNTIPHGGEAANL